MALRRIKKIQTHVNTYFGGEVVLDICVNLVRQKEWAHPYCRYILLSDRLHSMLFSSLLPLRCLLYHFDRVQLGETSTYPFGVLWSYYGKSGYHTT